MSAPDKELFLALDIPYTREDWIILNWLDNPPDPWTVEDEMDLPEDLQDWSLFEKKDGAFVAK